MSVPQIAAELGVQYALEGSVRRVGDQVRIRAQLIEREPIDRQSPTAANTQLVRALYGWALEGTDQPH